MYFTQEDLKRIEQWLQQRTVKDSSLPTADPLEGSESLPILQDGENKTMPLNEFVKAVALMELPDFYNVSVKEKKFWLPIEQAIALVPVKQRKLGLYITFHNANGNWCILQFRGESLMQWDAVNLWGSPIQEAIEDLVVYPDEEDITGVRDGNRTFLKFKNRDYNPEEFSGMGMIILRKNLVGTPACAIDDEDHYKNILTQEMISQPNTVYIIEYDFDLDGKQISLPENTTLWFQGGSINNGSIYMNRAAVLGAFEFADMGSNLTMIGHFNTGQVMTFSNDSYQAKDGEYFTQSTKTSSATEAEDKKNESETFYKVNEKAYATETRQELRWYNGEEWILILDITDYNEIKSIINDLIDKHNAEMAACYKYFKARCYALEVRMDDAEKRLDNAEDRLDAAEDRLDKVEGRLDTAEGDITNIKSDITTINTNISNLETSVTNQFKTVNESITNINESITNLTETINNLNTTINTAIEDYITNHIIGTAGVKVNGTTYSPDTNGIVTLPDYPTHDDVVPGTLSIRTSAGVLGTYNGSKDVSITVPSGGDGGGDTYITAKEKLTIKQGTTTLGEYTGEEAKTIVIPEPSSNAETADKVNHKLKFTGAVTAEYDGSSEVTVNIPSDTSSGGTAFDPKTLTIKDASGSTVETFNATADKSIQSKKLTITDNSGVSSIYDPFKTTQEINFREILNGSYYRPVLLFAGTIKRSSNTSTWSVDSNYRMQDIITSIAVSQGDHHVKINIAKASNYTIVIANALATFKDTTSRTFNQNSGGGERSHPVGMQCGVSGTSIYARAWRLGNKNNDSADDDPVQSGGRLLSFNLAIFGYAYKNS